MHNFITGQVFYTLVCKEGCRWYASCIPAGEPDEDKKVSGSLFDEESIRNGVIVYAIKDCA